MLVINAVLALTSHADEQKILIVYIPGFSIDLQGINEIAFLVQITLNIRSLIIVPLINPVLNSCGKKGANQR